MMSHDESTAVFVHESRFPLRILRRLVPADARCTDPAESQRQGSRSYVRRLEPLFSYEAEIKLPQSQEGSSSRAGDGTHRHSASRSNGNTKGKERAILHNQQASRLTGTSGDNDDDNADQGDGMYYGGNKEEERISPRDILTFESPVEGVVCEWCVDEGTLLENP